MARQAAMNKDNKDTDTSKPADEPPLRNYQEQPEANNELQKAIEDVPVKDYSDYEISIEAKEHYEDALFSDDESLEKALTAPQPAIPEPAREGASTAEKQPSIPPGPAQIDYESFFTEKSLMGEFSLNQDTPHTNSHLQLYSTGLNNSFPAEKTPLTEVEIVEETEQPPEPLADEKPDKEPAKAHEKLLSWGKSKLNKNKEQLDEYLGRSLPERALPLEFKFAALKNKKDFENIVSPYEIEKQLTNKGRQAHTLLKQADEDLANVVKCQLSNKARLQILEAYTPTLFEKLRAIKGTQGKTPPYPYEEKKLLAAEHAQNVARNLITGYKQVFAALYESANTIYAPQRKTVNLVAVRLADALCLEQNLLNALHRPIPPASIKSFNKLFHALSRYEPEWLNEPIQSMAMEETCTIKVLFTRYQALLSFDMMSLSPTLHKLLNQYLNSHLDKLDVLAARDWNTPPHFSGKAWVLAHDSSEAAKLASAASSDRFTPLFIRVDRFFNQVKSDYDECLSLLGSPNPAHSSNALQGVGLQHSTTLMSELNRYVYLIENNKVPQAYTNYQAWPCKIYSGFTGSYSWLDHHFSKLNQPPRKKGEPAPVLPKKPAPGTSEWLCALEDGDTLYLQTTERKGTAALDVGWLLLVVQIDENDNEKLSFIKITRVERGQANSLNVVAEKVGEDAINTVLTDSHGTKLPAILTSHKGAKVLLCNHKESFWTGKTVEASLPNRSTAILKIDRLYTLAQQWQLLTLE